METELVGAFMGPEDLRGLLVRILAVGRASATGISGRNQLGADPADRYRSPIATLALSYMISSGMSSQTLICLIFPLSLSISI